MQYIYRHYPTKEVLQIIRYGARWMNDWMNENSIGEATPYPPVPRKGETVMLQGDRIVMHITHDPMDGNIFIDVGSPL